MTLDRQQKGHIDSVMQDRIYKAFDSLDDWRDSEGLKPSELARELDYSWDLGDYYREWYESGDEEWE